MPRHILTTVLLMILAGPSVAQVPAVYVCPPCGCAHDGQAFSEPGACPSCNMTLVPKTLRRNVAIVIWDGVEILDFAGPSEVFASARAPDGREFNVYTVARTRDPIVSQGFITVTPQYTIDDCPKPDIFVLPGGGSGRAMADERLVDWVRRSAGLDFAPGFAYV